MRGIPKFSGGHLNNADLRLIAPLSGVRLNKDNKKLRKSVENYEKVGNTSAVKTNRKNLAKSSLGFNKETKSKKECTKLNSKVGEQKTKSVCKLGHKKGAKSTNGKIKICGRSSLLVSNDITKEYSFKHIL